MSAARAVVFDLGKVLLDFDYGRAMAKIAPLTRWCPDRLKEYVLETDLLLRYETGLLSSEAFHAELCTAGNMKCPMQQFAELFGDIFTPIEDMIGLQANLRAAGISTYIFSNTNELAIRYIQRTYPFFAGFTDYVLSFEQQSMKPDSRIYEVVEHVTGRKGSQLIYVDDRPENVNAGAARGWNFILHHDPHESIRLVRSYLGLAPVKTHSHSLDQAANCVP